MVLKQTIIMKWHGANRKTYEAIMDIKGNQKYKFTKIRDEFEMDWEDALKTDKEIWVICDYCGKVFKRKISHYHSSHKDNPCNKDACEDCVGLKIQDNCMIKYGVKNYSQIDSIRSKISSKLKTDSQVVYDSFVKMGFIPLFKPEDYKGNKQQLPFICSHHKDMGIQYKSYDMVSRGHDCWFCGVEKRAKSKTYSKEYVYEEMRKKGMIPEPNQEYKNYDSVILYRCIHHSEKVYKTKWKYAQKVKGCPECAKEVIILARQLPFSIVEQEFKEKNLKLISTEKDYINNRTKLKFICLNHEHMGVQESNYFCISQSVYGCKHCGNDAKSGENNSNWAGGFTDIKYYTRSASYIWKMKTLKHYQYSCALTDKKYNLAIHHLNKPFLDIFYEAIEDTKIPLYQCLDDYSDEQTFRLMERIKYLHEKYGLGICLHEKLHNLFHAKYGHKDNNAEQFEEFKMRLKNGEFDDFLKENELTLYF